PRLFPKNHPGNESPGTSGADVGDGGIRGVGAAPGGNILLPGGPSRDAKNSTVYDWKNTSPGAYTNPTTYSMPANASNPKAATNNSVEMSHVIPSPLPMKYPASPRTPSGINKIKITTRLMIA